MRTIATKLTFLLVLQLRDDAAASTRSNGGGTVINSYCSLLWTAIISFPVAWGFHGQLASFFCLKEASENLIPRRDLELAKFEAFLERQSAKDINAMGRGVQQLSFPIKG